MKEKMIHPKRLAYFAEVFKCGSLNGAADRLNMVQAGIGRQIQLLEQELGSLLFERRKRGGRGMVPTEVAQILYDHYCRYCDWQGKMEAAVSCEPAEKERVISAKRLFYFSQVFQHGSINAVADHLNRVQAGIGRQIQLLERELGVRLFERGTNGRGMVPGGQGRGMVPTEAAETLYDFYHQYRDWQDKLEAAIEEWRSMKRGDIRIAIFSSYADALMEEVIDPFYRKHPSLNIEIKQIDSTPHIKAKILEDEVSIGIIHGNPNDPGICCHARTLLPICMLVNQHHPLAIKEKGRFAEIAPYPFVFAPYCYNIQQVVRSVEISEKIQLHHTFIIDSDISRKKAAIAGHGGVLMTTFAARQEIQTGKLIPFEIDHPAFTSTEACLITKRGRLLSPAANQLCRLIASRFSLFSSSISKEKPLFPQHHSSSTSLHSPNPHHFS